MLRCVVYCKRQQVTIDYRATMQRLSQKTTIDYKRQKIPLPTMGAGFAYSVSDYRLCSDFATTIGAGQMRGAFYDFADLLRRCSESAAACDRRL